MISVFEQKARVMIRWHESTCVNMPCILQGTFFGGDLMLPIVITFTAFSNTGKTTYLEKLIPCLKAVGLRIAVVKHDGHDFQADVEGKDSWRFAQAGAEVVAIASQQQFAMFQYRPVALENILSQINDVDLILTEGYKHGPYPKIALYRTDSGNGLSVPEEECLAIVGDYPKEPPCPVFPLENAQPLANYLFQLISKQISDPFGICGREDSITD